MDVLLILGVGFLVFLGIAYAWVAITGKQYDTPADAVKECLFMVFCIVSVPFVFAYAWFTGQTVESLFSGNAHEERAKLEKKKELDKEIEEQQRRIREKHDRKHPKE